MAKDYAERFERLMFILMSSKDLWDVGAALVAEYSDFVENGRENIKSEFWARGFSDLYSVKISPDTALSQWHWDLLLKSALISVGEAKSMGEIDQIVDLMDHYLYRDDLVSKHILTEHVQTECEEPVADSVAPRVSADRFNSGKPKLSYVLEAREALVGVARVLEKGAEKYSRGNWQKGLPWTEVVDSATRHLTAFLMGQDNDEETGLPHIDHVLCNMLFLSQYLRTHPEMDDRQSKSEA